MRVKRPSIPHLLELANRHRTLVFCLLTVTVCLLLSTQTTARLFEKWDYRLIDTRFTIRGESTPDDDIVIVGIDESSFSSEILNPEVQALHPTLGKMAQGWPYDRSIYADVIQRLTDAGARLVIFDIVFPGPSGPGDFEFADAIAEHQDRLILAYRFLRAKQQGAGQEHVGAAGEQFRIEYPYDDLLPLDDTGLLGLVNVWPSVDGVIREHRTDTTDLFEKRGLPGGRRLDTLAFAAAKKLREDTKPPDEFFLINYRAAPRSFDYVQIEQLFLPSHWQNDRLQSGAFFKDKIVFIGPLAEEFKDLRPTPLANGQLMPGVEIHANILSTIRHLDYIESASSAVVLTITLVLALFAQLLAHSLRMPAVRALIVLVVFATFAVITQWLFEAQNIYVPSLKPVTALLSLSTLFILFDFTLEQYERHRVRSYLDRYVTSNVANVILEDRGDFEASLKGKRAEVCIFFSDIRGFTTLSESMDPEELVSLLNEYFIPMVDIVLKADGTLQKFIGDAIMAVWGDTLPMSEEDKAVKGVLASLQMIEALETLNESITARGYAPLGIGMGLNYGEAIVGNIGHPQRMEFTVLGDAVNLAARLEGATKAFKQHILVGEGVYRLAKSKIVFRFVGRLQVKGKLNAVPVYSPVAPVDQMDATARQWLNAYELAITAYFERRFEDALNHFHQANEILGGDDFLCISYSEKCREYAETPPPDDWDGTDKLTTK